MSRVPFLGILLIYTGFIFLHGASMCLSWLQTFAVFSDSLTFWAMHICSSIYEKIKHLNFKFKNAFIIYIYIYIWSNSPYMLLAKLKGCITVSAESLVKASGSTHNCYWYTQKFLLPKAIARELAPVATTATRQLCSCWRKIIILCHHLDTSWSPPQSFIVSHQSHGTHAHPLAQPHACHNWTKASHNLARCFAWTVLCVQVQAKL